MSSVLSLAELFQACADPTRLRIIALLRSMELSVGELAQVLGQSQPRVSRHIKLLADAGIVERRKEGSWVFLLLSASGRIEPLLAMIDVWGDDSTADLFRSDHARLSAVRAERAAAAERYFAAQAGAWDQIRSLHVAESQVEDAIGRAIGPGSLGCLVDIGTGTGRMIELFGPRAESAIGIDRSSEMLRLARAKLDAAGIRGASVRQGDLYALPIPDDAADCVLLHQVLHYAHSPAAAIAEAVRILAPGGRLLVIDFAPHEREELRRNDAHVRLGFADDAVVGWLLAGGLDAEVVEHLAGGELTVTIWRGCKPASNEQGRAAA